VDFIAHIFASWTSAKWYLNFHEEKDSVQNLVGAVVIGKLVFKAVSLKVSSNRCK